MRAHRSAAGSWRSARPVRAPRGAARRELVVAGLAYFEVSLPRFVRPASGTERFLAGVRVGAGGALNTAAVARALGIDACVAHPAGDGLTDAALQALAERIGLPAVRWRSPADPAVSLVFPSARDRSFLSVADYGALAACPGLPITRWVHVPGLREADVLAEPLARARAAGARISVAGSWAPRELRRLRRRSDRPWDLLVLNAREAAHAVGDPAAAAARLSGVAPDVVVTAGPGGAFGVLGGRAVRATSPRAATIDPTGAGDAFCAGLLAGLLRGLRPARALGLACRVAARALTFRGGVPPDARTFADLRGAR